MRAEGVVDVFPLAEFAIELFHFQRAGGDLVELFGMGAVGALDGTIEFGERGGRTKRCRPRCWQACSKSAANSEAAVDLQGAKGKGHAVLQGVEELGRGLRRSASVRLENIPT